MSADTNKIKYEVQVPFAFQPAFLSASYSETIGQAHSKRCFIISVTLKFLEVENLPKDDEVRYRIYKRVNV